MSSENEKNENQAVAEADDARAPSGGSPLDAEPAVRARRVGGKRVRRVKEYEEDVPPNGAGATNDEGPAARHFAEQHPPRPDEVSEFESDSPLDAEADAALLMVEVDRIGPCEGQGWVGRMFDHGDGRGPQPVSYGRVASVPDDHQVYERIQSLSGGGLYRFVRRGKKPVTKPLGGPPLPLPSEQGAHPGAGFGPGFGQGTLGAGYDGFGPAAPADPFDDPNYDPSVGVDPQEVAQTGLNGWYRGGPYNRLLFYVDGVPSRPPRGVRPPRELLGGAAAAFGGYDPAAYDHSERDGGKTEKLIEALILKLDRPATDPMAGMAAMMKAQMDADRLRWERERADADRRATDERAAADRKAAADAAEATRRWESEKLQRENEFKLMMARLEKESEKAAALKGNDVEIAKINAAAAEKTAASAAISAEKMAQISADANNRVLDIMLKKSDDVGLLTKGMQIAADLTGGKSTVAEVSAAAKDIIPSLIDGAIAYKQTSLTGATSDSHSAGPTDDEMLSRMAGLIAKMCIKQTPPDLAIATIGGACDVSGYDVAKIDPLIAIGTPATAAILLENEAKKAADEGNRKRFNDARAFLLSEPGKAWFLALKAAYQKRRFVAPQIQAQPPAGQIAGPGPSTPKD